MAGRWPFPLGDRAADDDRRSWTSQRGASGMSRGGRGGGVAVYVTSHGFGHLNRTSAVVSRIPRSIPVSIRSHANLFGHWHQRVRRPIELGSYVSDSGAVNPPGDSNTTDRRATLELAMRVRAEALARLDEEV